MTDRQKVLDNLAKLRDAGISDERIVDYLLNNWMTSSDAKEATADLLKDEELDDDGPLYDKDEDELLND